MKRCLVSLGAALVLEDIIFHIVLLRYCSNRDYIIQARFAVLADSIVTGVGVQKL